MDIATGQAEAAPPLLMPLNDAGLPGVAPSTPVAGLLTGPTVGARDTTGEYQTQMAAVEADCRAAQSAGMSAENGRRDHYAAGILPVGASYGDAVDIPVVPTNALPPAQSDEYPWQGMEPTPAAAGIGGYVGDEPH